MQLSIRDVSQLLKVPEATVQRWVADGGLPARRINSQLLFNRNELLEWATLCRRHVPDDFLRNAAAAPDVGLTRAMRAGGIVFGIPGGTKQAVLRAVVEQLPLPNSDSREELAALFWARECAGSTSIGGGIAIPHPRHPIVIAGAPTSITLCFPQQPIPFDAPDGRPVFALFAIVAPNPRTHLYLLARLVAAVRDPGVEKALKTQRGCEEILAEFARLETFPVPRPQAGLAADPGASH
jgi:PTS system nitrogen regulatory IIA component